MAKNVEPAIVYGIHDKPPGVKSLAYGFQHTLNCLMGAVVVPLILSGAAKMSPEQTASFVSLTLVVAGIATVIQVSIGTRLPIVQGASYSFLAPAIAILAMGKSPAESMSLLAGAIMVGSLFEIFIGYANLVGYIRKVITPVVMATVVVLICLGLFEFVISAVASNWIISLLVFAVILFVSQVLPRVYGKVMIGTLSYLIGGVVGYILVAIFLPSAIDFSPVGDAPWLFGPQPFFWGAPKFNLAAILIIIAGYLASTAESIGDYHVCSHILKEPDPSKKMINRGIGAEGLGCLIAGFFGGPAVTSYTDNIGIIGLTRVGSRFVVYIAAGMLVILGIVGKVGAIIATMPMPVKGGLYLAVFGLVVGFGASNLRRLDLGSTRNVLIFGSGLLIGLGCPAWVAKNPLTFSPSWLSQWIQALLATPMAMGGIWAAILDQVLPGTDEERGVATAETKPTPKGPEE